MKSRVMISALVAFLSLLLGRMEQSRQPEAANPPAIEAEAPANPRAK